MMHRSYLILTVISTVCCPSLFSEAAITGPKANDAPIRLKPKATTNPHSWELKQKPVETKKENTPIPPRFTKVPDAKVKLLEPPNNSYIKGSTVYVKLEIIAQNQDAFHEAYDQDGRICLSLDDGPFHCWPIDSRIMFSNAVDGSHSLVAKLYRNGELKEETSSESVTFTTVTDPTDPNQNPRTYHDQGPSWSKDDTPKPDEDAEAAPEDSEEVQVAFPLVHLISPADRVSYTGSDVTLTTFMEPRNPDIFEKYFQHSFTCFNIDIATAHACFPLFKNRFGPLVIGLENGMHTIEASLSNPNTGDLLEESSRGTTTFFMAGKSNEGAAYTAEINIRGKLHRIPIVRGGCLAEQTKALCRSVGLEGQAVCVDPVFQHLQLVANQIGFFTSNVLVGGSLA